MQMNRKNNANCINRNINRLTENFMEINCGKHCIALSKIHKSYRSYAGNKLN